jgi:hypothetical protein
VRSPIPSIFLVAVIAGCGVPEQSELGATFAPTGSPSEQATPPAPPSQDVNIIAWIIRLGTDAPNGPGEAIDYWRLADGVGYNNIESCEEVWLGNEDRDDLEGMLYGGAAAACLAAFHQRSDLWDAAIARYEALSDPPGSCFSRATYELLAALVQAHETYPARGFTVDTSSARPLQCAKIFTVMAGPTAVEITGTNLEAVTSVDVGPNLDVAGERPYTLVNGSLVVVPYDPGTDTEVCVSVHADPEPWIAHSSCVSVESDSPTEPNVPTATPGASDSVEPTAGS